MKALSIAIALWSLVGCGTRPTQDADAQSATSCDRSLLRTCLAFNGGEVACQKHRGRNNCTAADVAAVKGGGSDSAASTPPGDNSSGESQEDFSTVATLYTTEDNAMEGGPKDRCGRSLGTLEQYLAGKAAYVSVAMDRFALPYGSVLRIPEIEKRLGVAKIEFRVVDTGGAFRGKGRSRMDICVGNSQSDIFSSRFGWISQDRLSVQLVRKASGSAGGCP